MQKTKDRQDLDWKRLLRVVPRLIVLLAVPLYFWPWSPAASSALFQTVLLASFVNFATDVVNLCADNKQKTWINDVCKDDSAHYLFFVCIFMGSYPIFFAMSPLFTSSLFHVAPDVSEFLKHPKLSKFKITKILSMFCDSVVNYAESFRVYVSWAELFVVIVLITNLLENPLQLFLYIIFLRLRYSVSQTTQDAVKTVFGGVDVLLRHESCPVYLRKVYQEFVEDLSEKKRQ